MLHGHDFVGLSSEADMEGQDNQAEHERGTKWHSIKAYYTPSEILPVVTTLGWSRGA